jgi:UTP-glucose-1-phosphate uridylyltransferase
LVGADGKNLTAIEVELTLKTKARLERILRGYLRNQNVSRIRYYAPTNIGEAVRRAARAVGAERLLELAPLPVGDASISRGRP